MFNYAFCATISMKKSVSEINNFLVFAQILITFPATRCVAEWERWESAETTIVWSGLQDNSSSI